MNKKKYFIQKQSFNPNFFGIFINPIFIARRNLYKHIRSFSTRVSGRTLDVGCGKKPYKELFTNVTEYIGLDIENPGHPHNEEDIDVFYDGEKIPFDNGSFDSVICNQVLEHVFKPNLFLSEINRVLKREGIFLLTVPFAWDEHEQPNDFGRYSSFGLKYILQESGFEILKYKKSTRGFHAVSQLFILYLYKIFYSNNRALNLFLTTIFIAPLTIVVSLIGNLFPDSKDFFLDNVVLLKKSS